MKRYSESEDAGNGYRKEMLDQVHGLIERGYAAAERKRTGSSKADLSSIDRYEASTLPRRRDLAAMLGWPLTLPSDVKVPAVREVPVAEDDLGRITRVWIGTLPGVETYGILFRPHGTGPFPLVLSLHGGGGTPEKCSGFSDSESYHDMTRRVLRRGCAVFAPQLLLWDPEVFGPAFDRVHIDRQLKQLGGSIAALDLYRLRRSLDHLLTRPEIDPARVGMIGLSYGGFYALFAAAIDTRIQAVVSSCFFNSRQVYDWPDWVWFDAANTFMDAEVAMLVCPRRLYIEVGTKDDLFDVRHARPEAGKVRDVYETLGIPERFVYKEFEGGHELDTADHGIDFLCRFGEERFRRRPTPSSSGGR